MKSLFTFLLIISALTGNAQKIVYDQEGNKKQFISEELDIEFTSSSAYLSGAHLAPALAAAIPTALDVAFRLTQNKLENDLKKYTAEYTKHKSHIKTVSGEIPEFKFIRKVSFDGNNYEPAFEITFKPYNLENVSAFYYAVDNISLRYSAAKTKAKHNLLDYTIEIKINYIDKEKKKQIYELTPIVISSVKFTDQDVDANSYGAEKHYSEVIPSFEAGTITDVHIKIIESNPYKVRSEKILSYWNDNKDDLKDNYS